MYKLKVHKRLKFVGLTFLIASENAALLLSFSVDWHEEPSFSRSHQIMLETYSRSVDYLAVRFELPIITF